MFNIFRTTVEQENPRSKYIEISRFPIDKFRRDLMRLYKTSRLFKIFDNSFVLYGRSTVKVHKFFVPELYYILGVLPARPEWKSVRTQLLEKTWYKCLVTNYPNRVNKSRLENITRPLKNYQEEFLNLYDLEVQRNDLDGYILAFEQGLGKTFTSLALMECLDKDCVIIVAPKNTLREAWVSEIDKVFKTKQDTWVIGDVPKEAKYYIVNYESMDKLLDMLPLFKKKQIGIIVDECHYFRNKDTKRVKVLFDLKNMLSNVDLLMMSGTPIKAMGSEIIPALKLIDRHFTPESEELFKKIFGMNTIVALDIVSRRLNSMMHRVKKEEVLNLPEKNDFEVKIKIPNGKDYTLAVVQKRVQDFVTERQKYYQKNFDTYLEDYLEGISYFEKNATYSKMDYDVYTKRVEKLRKKKHTVLSERLEDIKQANIYEKENIIPALPQYIKHRFKKAKSVVKYVELTIMGEVIGGLLNNLRAEMFRDMIEHSPIIDIINNAIKKTICFTSYVDVLEFTDEYLRDNKFETITIYGGTKDLNAQISKFKQDEKINPLLTTIGTMATGVTVVEANTVIFLNRPWRFVDADQAAARVHRIGQDVPVEVYYFVLDTNNTDNLSTRMESILEWSKKMFDAIVGGEEILAMEDYAYFMQPVFDNKINEIDLNW